MEPSKMEVSSEEETSRGPTQQPAVPLELYRKQIELNEKLQAELASLNRRIEELTKELQDARRERTPQKNKRRKVKPLTTSESSSEEEPATPPTQRPAQAPREPQAPERPPQAPERTPSPPTEDVEMEATAQNQTAPTEETSKAPRIPPVILRKQERWTEVRKMLDAKQIRFAKARLMADGVAITAASPNDYRKMTTAFNQSREEYHTYTLAEDRQLRVVVRGLPSGIPLQEIQEDLREQGYPEARVQRMTSRKTKQAMPLVLVQVPQNQTAILEVKRCCSLVVRVERQRVQHQASQCHRCQRFGHGQSRCTAAPKCVKCGQEHATATCTKPREEPAKCANCGGDHPASYRGCPKFPKAKKAPTPTEVKRKPEAEKRTPAQAPRPATTSGVSYAQAAAGKKTAPKKTAPPTAGGNQQETMERALAQFQQQIQQQMLEMFKTMVAKLPSLIQV